MPVEQVAQPCEVCGVETVQRCSSCVKAGIDLFFCGKEHQKLVWSAHKTVCGPGKAHPFAVMPLTYDEQWWLLRNLDKVVPGHETTLREQFGRVSRSDEAAEVIVKDLYGDAYERNELANKALLVNWLRAFASYPHKGDEAALRLLLALGDGQFDAFSAAQSCARRFASVSAALAQQGNTDTTSSDSAWLSTLQHKSLLVNRLQQLTFNNDGYQAPMIALHRQADARFLAWIRAGAGSDDPKVARALAEFEVPNAERTW
ncbi:hypothetical protein JCM8208_004672 [Rhodotorula glutinis]